MSNHMTSKKYESLIAELLKLGFKSSMRIAKSADIGRWDCSNEATVIVTTSVGRVYTRRGQLEDPSALLVIDHLCPMGRGGFVSPGLLDLLNPDRDPNEESEYASAQT